MSAWIEIAVLPRFSIRLYVALLVSAWIEIIKRDMHENFVRVALLVSAWIEISLLYVKMFVV